MYNDILKSIKKAMDIKKDSKFGVYVNEDLDIICELKNLNNISAHYFLFLLLDELINQDIINKKMLLDMINEIL